MFGGNLPDNDPFTLALISNEEALSVLQRSRNNRLLFDDGERVVWMADDLAISERYAALFYVDRKPIVENKARWNSRLLTHDAGKQSDVVHVNIGGAKKLYLVVTPGGDYNDWDHADWIEPKLIGNRDTLHLTSIPWVKATSGWSTAKVNQSVGGNSLTVDNRAYADGIGTHATSIIEYDVPDGYNTFSSIVGLDGECVEHTEGATVTCHIFTEYPTGSPPEDSIKISLKAEQLGVKGTSMVRDLWGMKDLGEVGDGISLFVRNHGAALLRIRETN
jgi:hypothetical protein